MIRTPVQALIVICWTLVNPTGTIFNLYLPVKMIINKAIHKQSCIISQLIKSGIGITAYLGNIDPPKYSGIKLLTGY